MYKFRRSGRQGYCITYLTYCLTAKILFGSLLLLHCTIVLKIETNLLCVADLVLLISLWIFIWKSI
jgi:hypothetical protein